MAVYKAVSYTHLKLARISAEKINEKGYEVYADKLAGQTLVIENAGRLKRETLAVSYTHLQ